MGNSNHDPANGRFTSGSSSAAGDGDHLATSPSTSTRNVPGAGTVSRATPITRHANAASVGTEKPGAMSKYGPGVTSDPFGPKTNTIIKGKGVDFRHYGVSASDPSVAAKTDLGMPSRIRPGKLDPRLSTLVSAAGAKPRVRVRAR